VPDKESATINEHAQRVRDMFGTIAGRYDLLNHLLSANIDTLWRRAVAAELAAVLRKKDAIVLDVACGTGDLSLTLSGKSAARIVGVDFCRPMLAIAATKVSKRGDSIPFVEGDALSLPFAEKSFDAVTIAFGLRNLASLSEGLKELKRVLKPNGKLVVLECSKPRTPVLRSFYKFYFSALLPTLGGWISGSKSAYQYLPDSVSRFPDQETLASLMRETGLENVRFINLTGGVAALHIGSRTSL